MKRLVLICVVTLVSLYQPGAQATGQPVGKTPSLALRAGVAQEPIKTKVPAWDARGVGPLPRMGITSIDVSDDGKEIVVGTIAAFGDPNVIVLDDTGKIVRHYKVGQQWIDNVAFVAGSHEALAICTMPAGKAGDRVEAFLLKPADERSDSAGSVSSVKLNHDTPWFFHYGDHSNHPTMKLARAKNATALLAGNQLLIYRKGKEPATIRVPVSDPDASVSLAVAEFGWAVVGTTTRDNGSNLYLFDPDQKKPVWSRAANKDVEKAPALEKGLYGTPTLPDGTRAELPQRDEKVWAPLSVAIQRAGSVSDGKLLIAAADYQGWQRWVRSSATMKDDNQGLRFMPTKPTITVYDEAGKAVKRYGGDVFRGAFWCDLLIRAKKPMSLDVWTHHWKCRGLAGEPILPTENPHEIILDFRYARPIFDEPSAEGPCLGHALNAKGDMLSGWWGGMFNAATRMDGVPSSGGVNVGGPALVRFDPRGDTYYVASTAGTVTRYDLPWKRRWWTDLNLHSEIPPSPKPWVANARATPIAPSPTRRTPSSR